ncbi:MAG: hypothetical protein GY830_04755 [Bacteroidetes bacterium]|nr:hypothetical protein [Bacteroidota bacterium]
MNKIILIIAICCFFGCNKNMQLKNVNSNNIVQKTYSKINKDRSSLWQSNFNRLKSSIINYSQKIPSNLYSSFNNFIKNNNISKSLLKFLCFSSLISQTNAFNSTWDSQNNITISGDICKSLSSLECIDDSNCCICEYLDCTTFCDSKTACNNLAPNAVCILAENKRRLQIEDTFEINRRRLQIEDDFGIVGFYLQLLNFLLYPPDTLVPLFPNGIIYNIQYYSSNNYYTNYGSIFTDSLGGPSNMVQSASILQQQAYISLVYGEIPEYLRNISLVGKPLTPPAGYYHDYVSMQNLNNNFTQAQNDGIIWGGYMFWSASYCDQGNINNNQLVNGIFANINVPYRSIYIAAGAPGIVWNAPCTITYYAELVDDNGNNAESVLRSYAAAGFNILILGFWDLDSGKGVLDWALDWSSISDSRQKEIIESIHQDYPGTRVLVSGGGEGTQLGPLYPLGYSAEEWGRGLAEFAIENNLDGVDLDLESGLLGDHWTIDTWQYLLNITNGVASVNNSLFVSFAPVAPQVSNPCSDGNSECDIFNSTTTQSPVTSTTPSPTTSTSTTSTTPSPTTSTSTTSTTPSPTTSTSTSTTSTTPSPTTPQPTTPNPTLIQETQSPTLNPNTFNTTISPTKDCKILPPNSNCTNTPGCCICSVSRAFNDSTCGESFNNSFCENINNCNASENTECIFPSEKQTKDDNDILWWLLPLVIGCSASILCSCIILIIIYYCILEKINKEANQNSQVILMSLAPEYES